MADRVVKVTLQAMVQQYQAGMLQAAQATKTVGTEAEKLAQKRQAFEQLGRTVFTAGGVMAAGVGLAVKKFADFDQAMSNVAATGDDARASLDALRDAAIDAGARTVFSATESANAIEELAKAGISAKDILSGGLNGALDLAAAGGLGVAQAAEIAATTMQQFRLQGTEASHVADLLAAGAGKAMGDVSDMGQALNQAGLVANQFGLSVDETVGVLSAFASAGMLGSDAGTSMRTMLLRLANPTKEVTSLMADLGIEAYDNQGQFIGLKALAGELETSLVGMTQAQRDQTLAMIFGQDAIRGANILLREGADGIQEWTDRVNDQGYAAETAATRLDNLKGDVEALGGAFDSAMITMGEGANGPLRALVQGLTGLVDGFNDLPDWAQQTALGVAAVASAAGIAGGAFFLVVPKMAEFNTALLEMGPGAQKAGRALGRIAAVSGGVFGGLAVGITTANLLTEAFQNAGLAGEELANKVATATEATQLLDAAQQKGLLGGSNVKFAASQLDVLGKALDAVRAGSSDTLRDTGKGLVAANAISNVRELGEDLAKLAQTDLPAAQQQFRLLAESAGLNAEQQATLIDQMEPFKNVLTEQATAAGQAADGQALVNLAMGAAPSVVAENTDAMRELAGQAEATGNEVEGLADQIRAFGSATLDTRDAQRQFEQSFDDLADSIKDNGKSLDIGTQKGRENQAAIDDLAKSTYEYAAAIYEETGSQEQANDVIASGRERLMEMLAQFGITGSKAQDYANKLGLIPDNIDTAVRIETDGAQGAINRLIYDNNGRRITLNVVTNETTIRTPGGPTGLSRATGGAVIGPGSATSDSIPAMLSNGEHVLTAAEVAALGGQAGVYRFRGKLKAGDIPKFAAGGAVGYRIDRSELVDWQTAWRRGEVRSDAMNGNALRLVDQLFDIAAQIGGKYGATLNREARRSEGVFRGLERSSAAAEKRVESLSDRVSDLKDSASSMASRVASAIRSFFDIGALATTKTVTTGTSSARVVNGITVAGAGVTTSEQNTTTAGSIRSSLGASASRIKGYADKLKRLAAKGINAALLEELASLGVEKGEPITDALLTASKSDITAINKSYSEIGKYSDAAGKTVADANFSKLISAAEKQLRDAKRNADSIERKLEKEATRIINTINRALIVGTSTPVKKKAAGGPIYGPGTSTSDSIPAFLSNGENVWSAADVRAAGGQAGVERLKRLRYLTPTAARFASGGPVMAGTVTAAPVAAVVTPESARLIADEVARQTGAATGAALRDVRSADARDAVLAAARGVRS